MKYPCIYYVFFASRFNVDPSTGRVTLAQSLDYEDTTSYQLLFRAVDKGNPSREASVSLTISVLNYNDFGPVFNPDSYQTSVNEGEVNILIPVIVKVMKGKSTFSKSFIQLLMWL